jgi:hypothetical protein
VRVIGIAGTKADPVLVHFAAHCVAADVAFAVLDLMEVAEAGEWRLSVPPDDADVVSGSERVAWGPRPGSGRAGGGSSRA